MFDGVFQDFFEQPAYYAAKGCVSLKSKSYTRADVVSLLVESGHFGPWDDDAVVNP